MSKKIVTHRLSLDLTSQKLQATVTLAFGDMATHRLVVDLRHGADVLELPPGSYAIAVKDGVDVLDSVIVYGPDSAYPNCIVYDVTTAVTAVEGVHEARFIISYVDETGAQMTLASPKIALVVKEGILKGSEVALSDPYSAVIAARDAARKSAEDAANAAASKVAEHDGCQEAHKALFDSKADATKFESLAARIAALLVQSTGQDDTKVMSQLAVTQELEKRDSSFEALGLVVINGMLCQKYTI